MIRQWKLWHRLFALLVVVVSGVTLLPVTTFARGQIDIQAPVSLTIQYPCEGAVFRVYRVADVSVGGDLTLAGDFKNYAVSLKQNDQAGWGALAVTLETYAQRDNRKPVDSGRIGANHHMIFPQLTAGLYLVSGDRYTSGGYRYTPEPSLVMLPGLDDKDNWLADVTMEPKYSRTPLTPNDTVNRKVLKVWRNDNSQIRPHEITVQLLCDGEVWDTVTLNRQNSWRYEWEDLDADYSWKVAEEDVPGDYKVTISRSGITFVITNTADEPDRPYTPHTPGSPDEPTRSTFDIPDSSVPRTHGGTETLYNIPDSGVPLNASLPQTGQLWWPVPVLVVMGLLLIIAGLIRRGGIPYEE